jgi:hypothetical protein
MYVPMARVLVDVSWDFDMSRSILTLDMTRMPGEIQSAGEETGSGQPALDDTYIFLVHFPQIPLPHVKPRDRTNNPRTFADISPFVFPSRIGPLPRPRMTSMPLPIPKHSGPFSAELNGTQKRPQLTTRRNLAQDQQSDVRVAHWAGARGRG